MVDKVEASENYFSPSAEDMLTKHVTHLELMMRRAFDIFICCIRGHPKSYDVFQSLISLEFSQLLSLQRANFISVYIVGVSAVLGDS